MKQIEIGILINCVGTGPQSVANLIDQPEDQASQIIRVNLMSTIKGWRPLPYMSSYPASKAAINFFTSALQDEFRNSNIHVQCLVPLLVATKIAFYSAHKGSFWIVTAKDFAKQAVRLIGNHDLATGCIQHDIQVLSCIFYWLFVFLLFFCKSL
ncbi:unnamed protein product [Enterobius vermicularis]|uniref:Estradiol 17-beta-dehydrogenase 2 n=1 Tax=Enterobius vermicularis TaxID=51028 RepID=A0A0N4VJV0_ENTVE|nr:unnamed protein product [Enterobius vermicularis]